jgi:gliding motility-associated-like protein
MVKKMVWFLIPLMSWGQCDIEIYGFNPISTDLTLVVNNGQCGTQTDSIGEFLLALSFNPPVFPSPFQCLDENTEWALLLYPLDFPGFDIGQGPDNILQSGDTITFNILADTPLAGSGTLDCWRNALEIGSYFEECVILTIFQINDSNTLTGDSGLGGFPYPDVNIPNNFLQFSLAGACDPPPPPIVYGCTDPEAYNYNELATVSDLSCVYQGCLDEEALNYCADCEVEGECIYGPDDPDCNDPCIKVPNTFSPNNDGVNDYWQPITLDECWVDWECRVYNRWGSTVWWSADPSDKWLGNRLETMVPDGVYVWTIKARSVGSSKVVDMAGHVTIFR